MSKLKNTKKGMAKKALSVSLVAAMLATSNVPVWAAEDLFSAGEASVESEDSFSSEASANSVDTTEEAADLFDENIAGAINIPNANDDKIKYNEENSSITVTTGLTANSNNRYAIRCDVEDKETTEEEGQTLSNAPIGVSPMSRGNVEKTVGLKRDDIGKYLNCVVYSVTSRWPSSDTYTALYVSSVKIVGAEASDYYTMSTLTDEAFGNVLPSVNMTSQHGAELTGGQWYKDGNPVSSDYKTVQSDIDSTFEYKATLGNTGSDFDGQTVTVATVKIVGKATTTVASVKWSGFATEIANNGTLECDYDGNTHQPTIENLALTDGENTSGVKFAYTYKRDNAETNDFTSKGNIVITATVEEDGVLKKGETITATLTIKGIDISKNTAATLTANPLVYNKDGQYLNFGSLSGDALAEAVKEAGLVVQKDGKTLEYGTDYTITATTLKNEVGTEKVSVTITGEGNYTGTVTKKLDITAANLADAEIEDITSQPYTGNQIKPVVTVKLGDDTLVKDTDYTVEYSNNVNVGKDAVVTVKGKGNYTGEITKKFEITSISLANLKTAITSDTEWKGSIPYTGEAIDPIKDSYGWNNASAVWMKGRDFTVSYTPQNTNAGEVKAVLTGINNYAGQTEEITFTIERVSLKNTDVKVDLSSVTYSPDLTNKKDEIKAGLKVTYKEKTLVENQDFTVDSISVSGKKVTLTLTGIKNFKETVTVSANVAAKDINEVTLPKIDAQKYTGAEIKVVVTPDGLKLTSGAETLADKLALKDGTYTLTASDYYIINVENNTKVGTATINLGGIGNYTGKVALSFPIVDKELNGTIVDGITKSTILSDVKYSYADASAIKGITYQGLQVMDEKGNDITSKCDITYSENKAVGTATVTATGKDGFKFNAVNTFRIVPAELKGDLTLTKATFDYTGEEIKPEYTFKATDGKYTLVEGTDYTVEYLNNVNAAGATETDEAKRPTVKITGIGNYAGKDSNGKESSVSKYFTISPVTLSATDILAADVAYAGGIPVKPSVTITNPKSKKALVEGTDYTVKITSGGTNLGPATAVITLTELGKQNYELNKSIETVNFNVVAFDLSNATISPVADQTVTGSQIKPTVVVMNGDVRLVEGYDYEVSYDTNTEVGTGSVIVKALASNKNYVGSKTVTFNIVPAKPEVDKPLIVDVVVKGNTVTPVLSGDVDGAVGYDYVLSTVDNTVDGRVDISKNILKTNTDFYYVQEGSYYVYCHAWKRGEDGKKVFGAWSNIAEVKVTAKTPATPKITSVSVKGSTVTVKYTKAADATGYDVVLGSAVKTVNGEKRPVDYGTLVKKNIKGNEVTATFKNVKKGTFYAGLHAFNRTSEDGKKVFSKWSNVKKVTVK